MQCTNAKYKLITDFWTVILQNYLKEARFKFLSKSGDTCKIKIHKHKTKIAN